MNYKAVYKTAPVTPGLLIMDHKKDSDHTSKKKCNKPDCQKSNCWYVQMTLMPTSNDVLHQQDIKRFTCKTCQNNFFGQNELVHHRKREHPSKIRCKYFLTNTCRISSNQGALCGFRHDQLPLCAPNVANAAQGVKNQSPPCGPKKMSIFLPCARALCQDYTNKWWLDATAETPTTETAKTAPWAYENDNDPENEHEYEIQKLTNKLTNWQHIVNKCHKYDIDKQCSKQRLNATNVGTKH